MTQDTADRPTFETITLEQGQRLLIEPNPAGSRWKFKIHEANSTHGDPWLYTGRATAIVVTTKSMQSQENQSSQEAGDQSRGEAITLERGERLKIEPNSAGSRWKYMIYKAISTQHEYNPSLYIERATSIVVKTR